MTGVVPIGLRLSRAKGFNLQDLSRTTNGLPARVVNRSTVFGNLFGGFAERLWNDRNFPFRADGVRACAVSMFDAWFIDAPDFRAWALTQPGGVVTHVWKTRRETLLRRLPELRGVNLACSCPLDGPCHRNTLLRCANA